MRVEIHFDADGFSELALVAAVAAAGILLLPSSSVGLLDCVTCIPSCVRLATEAAFRPEPPSSSTAGRATVKRTRCGTCLACVLCIPSCVRLATEAALRPTGGRAVADPGGCGKTKRYPTWWCQTVAFFTTHRWLRTCFFFILALAPGRLLATCGGDW